MRCEEGSCCNHMKEGTHLWLRILIIVTLLAEDRVVVGGACIRRAGCIGSQYVIAMNL